MNVKFFPIYIFVIIAAAGCLSENPNSIKGSVTLDDQPLEQGNITFIPLTQESTKKFAAQIKDGMYFLENQEELNPGKYLAEINWAKRTGKKIPSADPGVFMEQTIQGIIKKEIILKKGINREDFKIGSKTNKLTL